MKSRGLITYIFDFFSLWTKLRFIFLEFIGSYIDILKFGFNNYNLLNFNIFFFLMVMVICKAWPDLLGFYLDLKF